MSRQRAQYLRRAAHRLRHKHRMCPNCRKGILTTHRIDVSTVIERARGIPVTVDGRTTCGRCGFDATSLQRPLTPHRHH